MAAFPNGKAYNEPEFKKLLKIKEGPMTWRPMYWDDFETQEDLNEFRQMLKEEKAKVTLRKKI